MTAHDPNGLAGPGADKTEDRPANLAELEAEIDQTRNAISGDLRTLGERLDPAHLKEEAKEVIVEAKNVAVETLHEAKNVATNTFREVKENAVNTVSDKVDELRENVRIAERETLGFVRENAVPLALIGLGVGWFFVNRQRSERRWAGEYAPRDDDWGGSSSAPARGRLDAAQQRASRVAGSARETATQARDRAGRWVDEASQRVQGTAGRVRGYAEQELGHMRESARGAEQRLSETAYRARDYASRELYAARDYTREVTDTHPLAVGAAALAAGIGVGLLLPATQPEQRLLGESKERLFDEAKGAAQQLASTAKQAARDVKETLAGSTPS